MKMNNNGINAYVISLGGKCATCLSNISLDLDGFSLIFWISSSVEPHDLERFSIASIPS